MLLLSSGRRTLGLSLGRRAAGAGLSAGTLTTGSALAALATWPRSIGRSLWAHGAGFLHAQLAVVILVECEEGFGGVGDLVLINGAVLIGIQRGDKGGDHLTWLTTRLTGLAWLTAARGGAGLGGRIRRLGCRGRGGVLREQGAGGCECAEQ